MVPLFAISKVLALIAPSFIAAKKHVFAANLQMAVFREYRKQSINLIGAFHNKKVRLQHPSNQIVINRRCQSSTVKRVFHK